ncbi:MAG: response regulator transcription factor [Aquabacterium sp.]|nr:response regulator transcription factor [Aquabacterium sp.]
MRVAIADDHPIVFGGIQQLIATTLDMEMVGRAVNRQEVLHLLHDAALDVLVLDLSMPGVQGLSLLQELMAHETPPAVVILSMHNEGQIVQRAMKLGASAYVTKDSDPMHLLAAIRKVARGGKYIDPSLMDSVAAAFSQQPHERLSAREEQVLRLIVSGEPIGLIAERLNLSPKTISTHKTRIMHKLDVGNNADLVKYALKHGLG